MAAAPGDGRGGADVHVCPSVAVAALSGLITKPIMVGLQRGDFKRTRLQRCDSADGGGGRRGGGEIGNARCNRGGSNGLAIAHRLQPFGSIDDQRDAAILDFIDNVRAALRNLVDAGDRDPLFCEVGGGAVGSEQVETQRKMVPAIGSTVPTPSCDFANAVAKSQSRPMTSPVDFISGPSTGSVPGKRAKGKIDSLTA
jgi:hypothetical protein